MMLPDDLSR